VLSLLIVDLVVEDVSLDDSILALLVGLSVESEEEEEEEEEEVGEVEEVLFESILFGCNRLDNTCDHDPGAAHKSTARVTSLNK